MKTTVMMIAVAIGVCRPSLPLPKRITYANIIMTSTPGVVDPFVVVALVDHESGWIETAISKDGKDYGLGQVRRKFIPKIEWAKLLDGEFNLRKTISILEMWRNICKVQVKVESTEVILAGYAGHSKPKQGVWCGIGKSGKALPLLKSTKWILARAAKLAPG